MANLERVMQQLHDSEINAGVETFYAAGMRVWLGDTINGIQAETSIKPTGQQWPADVTAASWLHAVALRLYPPEQLCQGVRAAAVGTPKLPRTSPSCLMAWHRHRAQANRRAGYF